jgi:hypothetical protein
MEARRNAVTMAHEAGGTIGRMSRRASRCDPSPRSEPAGGWTGLATGAAPEPSPGRPRRTARAIKPTTWSRGTNAATMASTARPLQEATGLRGERRPRQQHAAAGSARTSLPSAATPGESSRPSDAVSSDALERRAPRLYSEERQPPARSAIVAASVEHQDWCRSSVSHCRTAIACA